MPDDRLAMPPRDPNKTHVALTLVLDVSSSMSEPANRDMPEETPIKLLNDCINEMLKDMKNDSKLNTIVDLSIFTFGDPNKQNPYQDFKAIIDVAPIQLVADDDSTYIVKVLEEAIESTRQRSNMYASAYKPWIVIITDGIFHDNENDLDRVGQIMKTRSREGKHNFFGFGVPGFRREQLEKFCEQEQAATRVVDIQDASNLPKLFSWIGRSMKKVSGTDPTALAEIENPKTIFI